MVIAYRNKIVLGMLLVANAHAVAAPINCHAMVDNVEKAICATPALMDGDRKIADTFAARLKQCAPPQRAQLRQTQNFWLRDRNSCANLLSDTDSEVKRCVAVTMAQRGRQLDRIGAACDLDAVADQYLFVDPDYLARFAARYEGKDVWVAGSVRLDRCDDPNASNLIGKVIQLHGTRKRFPVRFKAMPDERREWLCDQNPFSHWYGTVRRDGDKFYLFLTDLLGEPL
jgi:uncharacterized protein YecT (DUF1311 family)